MFRTYVLPWIVWIIYRLWSWTWVIETVEPETLKRLKEQNRPLIFAHWHGDELAIVPLTTEYRIATMTSTSADGSLIDFVLHKLGGATSRGSSTRGGVGALVGLIRLIREGYRASIAVDGPKGPLHQVKPGVFELAYKTQARIVPLGVSVSKAHVFQKSWNKAQLPLPFSRVVVFFSEPLPEIAEKTQTRSPEMAETLAQQIHYASQQATRTIAGIGTRC